MCHPQMSLHAPTSHFWSDASPSTCSQATADHFLPFTDLESDSIYSFVQILSHSIIILRLPCYYVPKILFVFIAE